MLEKKETSCMKFQFNCVIQAALFFLPFSGGCTAVQADPARAPAPLPEIKETLPAPQSSTTNYSEVLGWKNGRTPQAPPGFKVTKYADGFNNPRWLLLTPNGDVLVAESNSNHSLAEKLGGIIVGASKSNNLHDSANRITLLRDSAHKGLPDVRKTFLTQGLNQPFGMFILDEWLYVGNTNAVVRYPYKTGQLEIKGEATKIIDLPAGKENRHWTRNIIANKNQSKLYVAVGSGSNVAEKGIENELLRATILEINPDGSGLKVFASGLRNVVGMDWAPGTETLFAVVNERDGLGDELVPDYLTRVVENGFYGWPYAYWGKHLDARVKEKAPLLVSQSIVPDLSLGNHVAPLGMAFYTKKEFPKKYHNGLFIAEHGSWNKKKLAGYKVVFVPFANGIPSGMPEDFLIGFNAEIDDKKVYGRPVGVLQMPDGSLLVTDDVTNTIWRVSTD